MITWESAYPVTIFLVVIGTLLYLRLGWIWAKPSRPAEAWPKAEGNLAVVVTGSSTGIGRHTTLALAKLNYQVFATVRKEADAESLRAEGGENVHPVLMDVADLEAVARGAKDVGAECEKNGWALVSVVANAGIAVGGPLEVLAADKVERQFRVNVFGLLATVREFSPLLRAAKAVTAFKPRVVLVSSVAGRLASPLVGIYAASKHAVEAIGDALRHEYALTDGPGVVVVEPGRVLTAIWDTSFDEGRRTLDELDEYGKGLYQELGNAVLTTVEKETLAPGGSLPVDKAMPYMLDAVLLPQPPRRIMIGTDAKVKNTLRLLLGDRLMDGLVQSTLAKMIAKAGEGKGNEKGKGKKRE